VGDAADLVEIESHRGGGGNQQLDNRS